MKLTPDIHKSFNKSKIFLRSNWDIQNFISSIVEQKWHLQRRDDEAYLQSVATAVFKNPNLTLSSAKYMPLSPSLLGSIMSNSLATYCYQILLVPFNPNSTQKTSFCHLSDFVVTFRFGLNLTTDGWTTTTRPQRQLCSWLILEYFFYKQWTMSRNLVFRFVTSFSVILYKLNTSNLNSRCILLTVYSVYQKVCVSNLIVHCISVIKTCISKLSVRN